MKDSPLVERGREDGPSVHPDGQSLHPLPEGVSIRPLITHFDGRGSTAELFDPRWGWNNAPLTSASLVTIRPHRVKGWAYHRRLEDRFALIEGEVEIVLFDDREESSTRGGLSVARLTAYQRSIINIPPRLWHAVHNVGDRDVVMINFPTSLYEHSQPDKVRLPIDTDLIPYQFKDASGE